MSLVESVILKWPEILRDFLSSFRGIELPIEDPRLIVISGIGSSAAGGIFLEPFSPYPVIVSREDKLPRYVNERDLVIISSHSGNTLEAILSLRDAINRGIKPVVITSGGKLLKIAESLDIPIVRLKYNEYTSRSVVALLIVATYAIVKDLVQDVGIVLDKIPSVIEASIKEEEEISKIALRIGGKAVVSIGYGPFKPAMRRIVAEISENAKLPAFYKEIPEANHNYLLSVGHPGVVNIYPEHERRDKLISYADRLDPKRDIPIAVENRGVLGNFEILTKVALASIRLARLLGRDPDDISMIEERKQRLIKKLDF